MIQRRAKTVGKKISLSFQRPGRVQPLSLTAIGSVAPPCRPVANLQIIKGPGRTRQLTHSPMETPSGALLG